MKFYSCPECEAGFKSSSLVNGAFPPHKFLRAACPGSGRPVQGGEPGAFEYRSVDTRTQAGLEEAEKLQAQGWKIIRSGLNLIQFERRKMKKNPAESRPAHWIILKDYLSESSKPSTLDPRTGKVVWRGGAKDCEIWGPRNASKPSLQSLPLEFIIADDDGIIYYRGRADDRAEFQPLDMYGEPNAGATMIAYKNSEGLWPVL